MSEPVTKKKKTTKTISIGRHEANCTVCAHEDREEIERDFVDWLSPLRISQNYGLSGPMTVYRHARALGLSIKRERNVRAALVKIIEKAGDVDASAQAVVAAVQAYSKINAAGNWIERTEHVNLNDLFDRMTSKELEAYARDGKLPAWFPQELSDTALHSREVVSD
jgi:hypothetical protein